LAAGGFACPRRDQDRDEGTELRAQLEADEMRCIKLA
jgi:hypothetical protein